MNITNSAEELIRNAVERYDMGDEPKDLVEMMQEWVHKHGRGVWVQIETTQGTARVRCNRMPTKEEAEERLVPAGVLSIEACTDPAVWLLP